MTDITLFEAMFSARSIRRLSADPVPEELITRVLEAATQAPSGGNAQDWMFIVVRDPELRRQVGAVYRKGRTSRPRSTRRAAYRRISARRNTNA
jgi:nitroreductase